jgi:hypothetical protein
MGKFDWVLFGEDTSLSNPWDVGFNLLLWTIVFTIVARYKLPGKKMGFVETMKYSVLIMIVLNSVVIFALGTAHGAGLEHPLEVFLYVLGGAFVVLSLDTAVRWLDRFLLNEGGDSSDE